jgi:hypothetical protein
METTPRRPDKSLVRLTQRVLIGASAFGMGCLVGWFILTPQIFQPALGLVTAATLTASIVILKRREATQRQEWVRRIR